MKPYLSVLTLLAHSSIYKICILFAAIAAVHSLFLSVWIDRPLVTMAVFASELGALVWILVRNWTEGTSHHSYTLQRLSITEKEIIRIRAAYNLLCLLLFWGVQLVAAYIFYKRTVTGSQDLFLEFTGSGYLHSLMPGADWFSWIKDIAILTSLAIVTAMQPIWLRVSGKKDNWALVLTVVLTGIAFSQGTGDVSQKALYIFWSVYLPFIQRRDIKKKEAETP